MKLTTTAPWLSTEALAAELDMSPATIRYWRSMGTGPRGVRVGRQVRYRREDVEAWLDELAAEEDAARPADLSRTQAPATGGGRGSAGRSPATTRPRTA